MSYVDHKRRVQLYQLYADTGHRLSITRLSAGEKISVPALRPFEQDAQPGDWGFEAAPRVMGVSGVGVVRSDVSALVVVPELGDFRFGINGMGTDALEALTDFTFACFSPLNKEAHRMYKLNTRTLTAPIQLSRQDGVHLVVVSGTVDIEGAEYRAGYRYDLAERVITVTPFGADVVQCVLVAERDAPVVIGAVVPRSVSPRQIRQALNQTGLRSNVEAAVAQGDQDLRDWWEFATLVERNNPAVVAMAGGLGISNAQLDELFMLAGSL